MYNLASFASMISGNNFDVRVRAYKNALRALIDENSVVLDLGAGVCSFSFFALSLGAKRVYAIESNELVNIAKDVVRQNSLEDRLIILNDLSTKIELPEKVDIIFCDLRGMLPFLTESLSTVVDAKKRFLKEDGVFVPFRDTFFCSLVEVNPFYNRHVNAWNLGEMSFDFSALSERGLNQIFKKIIDPKFFFSEQQRLGEIDYHKVEKNFFKSSCELIANRDAIFSGVSMWFEAELLDPVRLNQNLDRADVTYSNSPYGKDTAYMGAYFPSKKSIALKKGDKVSFGLEVRPIKGQYAFFWSFELYDEGEFVKLSHSTLISALPPIED